MPQEPPRCGEFYITTNRAAKNFRVVRAPIGDPSETGWQPFIDHDPAVKIDGLTFFAGHLVVSEREAYAFILWQMGLAGGGPAACE